MQEIVLDFTGCKYIMRLYDILQEGFGFPDWFGRNLDALWDLLRDYAGCPPVIVTIKGVGTMPKELHSYMEEVLAVFADVHEEVPQMCFEVIS
ncbi:MAG: barstar family protein [Monoglobaceae bacterium]